MSLKHIFIKTQTIFHLKSRYFYNNSKNLLGNNIRKFSAFENVKSAEEVDNSGSESESDEYDHDHSNYDESNALNSNYIHLNPVQKTILALGTGIASFLDPTRAESIAVFGEVTAEPVLSRLYEKMLKDPEGAQILKYKPRINSTTIDLKGLSELEIGTFGRTYYDLLHKNQISPDTRLPVRFIKDPELAYVMQRYREIHDLVHALTGQQTNMLGEVLVKWIEGIQTGLPMCVTGGIFGATRLRPKQREKYIKTHLPWAVKVGLNSKLFLNVFYEQRWNDSVSELREYICPLLNHPPQ